MADSAKEEEPKTEQEPEKSEEPKEEETKEPPKEMKAVILTSYGGLKAVKVLKKPQPTPEKGEVLIKVHACGLNFQDLMVRQGAIDSLPKTPFILGFECAGEIEAVGEEVTDFKVGDRVSAMTEFRAWSEYVSVSSNYVYQLPSEMSYSDAVCLTLSFTVAYFLLFEVGGLTEGKSIFVNSVGGSVGQAIAQLSKTVPNVTVVGMATSSKHEALKDSVDTLVERGTDYAQEVRKTCPNGVDMVLDCLCGEDCNKSYSILKPMGKYILFGSGNIVTGETKSFFSVAKSWWQVDKVSPIRLFDENKTLSGFSIRALLYKQGCHDVVREVVKKVYSLWEQGRVKPVLDSSWALEDVTEAMQKLHDRKNVGKLVFDLSLEPKNTGKELNKESSQDTETSPPPSAK